MLDGINHDADEVLTGKNPDGDARLLAAIDGAFQDAFDGGCRADVPDPLGDVADQMESKPRSTVANDTELRNRIIDRAHLSGRKLGIYDVIAWLRANHYPAAAQAVGLNSEAIEAKIESDAARGC